MSKENVLREPDAIEKRRAYARKWAASNRDKINQYRLKHYHKNPELNAAKARAKRNKNIESYHESELKYRSSAKGKSSKSAYLKSNSSIIKQKQHEYYLRTKDRCRERERINMKRHRAERTNLFWAKKLRTNLYLALSGKRKSDSALKLLGCSIDLFKLHLQNQFRDGMQWNNYGTVWHIDHIRPCASFDLSNPEHQAKCFHYSNMQPLLAAENMLKGDKYDE